MKVNSPRKFAFGLLVLAALATCGVGWMFNHSSSGDSPAPVRETEAPGARSEGERVVCLGYVDQEHGIQALYPLQPGRVALVPVHEGQEVAAGKVLLRLEDRQASLRIKEADSALEAALAQLAEAQRLPKEHQSLLDQQQAALKAVRSRLSAARHQLQIKQDLSKRQLITTDNVAVAQDQVDEGEALEEAEVEKLAALKLQDPALSIRKAEAEVATPGPVSIKLARPWRSVP